MKRFFLIFLFFSLFSCGDFLLKEGNYRVKKIYTRDDLGGQYIGKVDISTWNISRNGDSYKIYMKRSDTNIWGKEQEEGHILFFEQHEHFNFENCNFLDYTKIDLLPEKRRDSFIGNARLRYTFGKAGENYCNTSIVVIDFIFEGERE